MKKICLISSSGGHYEQLLMLKKIAEFSKVYIVTEKTEFIKDSNNYYLNQINRKEKFLIFKMISLFFNSTIIFLKEKPDIVISTGALMTIPTLLLAKIFKKKVIFIESFAKTSSPTKTGKLIYKIADVFIVQWPELKKFYPNAIYLGSIY